SGPGGGAAGLVGTQSAGAAVPDVRTRLYGSRRRRKHQAQHAGRDADADRIRALSPGTTGAAAVPAERVQPRGPDGGGPKNGGYGRAPRTAPARRERTGFERQDDGRVPGGGGGAASFQPGPDERLRGFRAAACGAGVVWADLVHGIITDRGDRDSRRAGC